MEFREEMDTYSCWLQAMDMELTILFCGWLPWGTYHLQVCRLLWRRRCSKSKVSKASSVLQNTRCLSPWEWVCTASGGHPCAGGYAANEGLQLGLLFVSTVWLLGLSWCSKLLCLFTQCHHHHHHCNPRALSIQDQHLNSCRKVWEKWWQLIDTWLAGDWVWRQISCATSASRSSTKLYSCCFARRSGSDWHQTLANLPAWRTQLPSKWLCSGMAKGEIFWQPAGFSANMLWVVC